MLSEPRTRLTRGIAFGLVLSGFVVLAGVGAFVVVRALVEWLA